MKTNFFINVDNDGKMPCLSYGKPVKNHYVKYINNRPVLARLPASENKIWDYSNNTMYSIPGKPQAKSFYGGLLPYSPTLRAC